MSTRDIYAFPTTLSILRKYAQKALCTKTPLSRGGTGKNFTDTEKNDEMKRRFRLGLPYWQPSKKRKRIGCAAILDVMLREGWEERQRLIEGRTQRFQRDGGGGEGERWKYEDFHSSYPPLPQLLSTLSNSVPAALSQQGLKSRPFTFTSVPAPKHGCSDSYCLPPIKWKFWLLCKCKNLVCPDSL